MTPALLKQAREATEGPVFDRDGYPTDRTLELITTWPYDRFPELWAYLREAWNYTYGAMSEGAVEGGGSEVVLITGGWSGNESIVSALASNFMFRAIFWYQDTRGGRHVYRIPTHPMKEGE